ncbi:hypothetical protein Btru_052526 [Bulinus truncatus]|nr:hypothetical protein Btru_052526 [Bulinus truncatus]
MSSPPYHNSVERQSLDVVDRIHVTRAQIRESCEPVVKSGKQNLVSQSVDRWLDRVKEKAEMHLLGISVNYRLINESMRAVHEDGADYETFDFQNLWSRNKKQHSLALTKLETGQATDKNCSTLLFAVKSFLISKEDPNCTYVELFPGTDLCKRLKVTSIGEELYSDETIKKCIVECKGVSVDIYPILEQIFRIQR